MNLIGYYNRDGYRIENSFSGMVWYRAGNNPWESSSWVPPNCALPLRTLRQFCIRTGKEMAREMNAIFTGVFREDEE